MVKLSLQQEFELAAITPLKKQARLIVFDEPELIRKFLFPLQFSFVLTLQPQAENIEEKEGSRQVKNKADSCVLDEL